MALKARTQAIARRLTDFLKKHDRMAKTIVFCVDQEHADEMRQALVNLNQDLVQQYPDYVCRVTSDEGDVGRGTRLCTDYDKFYFNILDYTGSTRLFADPAFDGDPARITEVEVNEQGEETGERIEEGEVPSDELNDDAENLAREQIRGAGQILGDDAGAGQPRKLYYYDGGQVEISAHLVYELGPTGKQLRVVKYTDYTAETVRQLFRSAVDLRRRWAQADERAEVINELAERGIDFEELAQVAGQPEADPFDLLCHVAFNAPLRTRRERAERVRREKQDFFDQYGPEARAILNLLLDKYADHGTAQFLLPEILEVPPLSDQGNVVEIADRFGGPERLREAVNELQSLLYAV